MPIFGAKSRAMRGCASKLACGRRIGPRRMHRFYGKLRRIRNFPNGWTTLSARRMHRFFSETLSESAATQRADVGIGPYKTNVCTQRPPRLWSGPPEANASQFIRRNSYVSRISHHIPESRHRDQPQSRGLYGLREGHLLVRHHHCRRIPARRVLYALAGKGLRRHAGRCARYDPLGGAHRCRLRTSVLLHFLLGTLRR